MYLSRCITYHQSKLRQYARILRPGVVGSTQSISNSAATNFDMTTTPTTTTTARFASMGIPNTHRLSNDRESKATPQTADFTRDMLVAEWYRFINGRIAEVQMKKRGIPIRCANTPEHISENIVKFIIRTRGGDPDVQWAKMIGKTGDLFSPNCPDANYQYEVKSITSDGPISFSPTKKFCRLYVLDLRNMMSNRLILWCIDASSDSEQMKNLKINKNQTKADQSLEKRRPRIGWDMMYQQLQKECTMVYDGTFDGIFG